MLSLFSELFSDGNLLSSHSMPKSNCVSKLHDAFHQPNKKTFKKISLGAKICVNGYTNQYWSIVAARLIQFGHMAYDWCMCE